MKLRPGKIGEVLRPGASWSRMKDAAAALADDELAEAERLEKLGKRRINTLMVLKAERHIREGKKEKMLRLRTEVRI